MTVPRRIVVGAAGLWLAATLMSCGSKQVRVHLADRDPGRTLFETHCAGCHLNEGQWMRGEAPPLEGSAWVAGRENHLIRIVLHGLRGPIEVAGKPYNQEMPGFAPILTDERIASLITHLRKRFGENGTSPVLPEAVGRIRATTPNRTNYWTVEELLKQP